MMKTPRNFTFIFLDELIVSAYFFVYPSIDRHLDCIIVDGAENKIITIAVPLIHCFLCFGCLCLVVVLDDRRVSVIFETLPCCWFCIWISSAQGFLPLHTIASICYFHPFFITVFQLCFFKVTYNFSYKNPT